MIFALLRASSVGNNCWAFDKLDRRNRPINSWIDGQRRPLRIQCDEAAAAASSQSSQAARLSLLSCRPMTPCPRSRIVVEALRTVVAAVLGWQPLHARSIHGHGQVVSYRRKRGGGRGYTCCWGGGVSPCVDRVVRKGGASHHPTASSLIASLAGRKNERARRLSPAWPRSIDGTPPHPTPQGSWVASRPGTIAQCGGGLGRVGWGRLLVANGADRCTPAASFLASAVSLLR